MNARDDEIGAFIERVASPTRRRDAATLLELMQRVTGESPRMWSGSIIGFGQYHYRYESGREGDAPAAGYSPRKPATVVYLPDGVGTHGEDLAALGPHTTGVGCLYIKDLAAVDLAVLERIVEKSYRTLTADTYRSRARDSQRGRQK